MKTVLEILQSGTEYLEKRGVENPRLNMQLLLAHILHCGKLDLYLQFDRPLGEEELEPLRQLLHRRGQREPLQHLFGEVEFCGRKFFCDRRALIPRPETEELVEHILQHADWAPAGSRIADVGTGSGVIGLTLAAEWQDRGAVAVCIDVSPEALELAEENRERLGLPETVVHFVRSSLFDHVEGTFDLVVANLPYVATEEMGSLAPEVSRDPAGALDGGPGGTEVIQRLVVACRTALRPSGGRLVLEIGHGQADRVSTLLASEGFGDIDIVPDAGGIERIVTGARPMAGATESRL